MRILMPLPSEDFDPTETSVPWKTLTDNDIEVTFATPDAQPGRADPRMVDGDGLLFWKPILRASRPAAALYDEMASSTEFQHPVRWDGLSAADFDGLVLPGGHATGMRPYLESQELQRITAKMMASQMPVGAICHGVVLLARSTDPDGVPVIRGRRVTSLLESQELLAWRMTRLWLGDYYLTYDQTVEHEVREALGSEGQFLKGPFALLRDDARHLDRGFTVRDGNLLTARWPGDAHRFAHEFHQLLVENA